MCMHVQGCLARSTSRSDCNKAAALKTRHYFGANLLMLRVDSAGSLASCNNRLIRERGADTLLNTAELLQHL